MEGRVARRWRWDSKRGELVEVDLGRDDVRVAPDVMGDLPAYASPIDGRLIDGRAQRREDLKRNGCRPYEDGEREEMMRRKAADEAKLERDVGETVERFWATADTRKREQLARELLSGADTEYARR